MKAQHEQEMAGVNMTADIGSAKERRDRAEELRDRLSDLLEDLVELAEDEKLAFDRVFSKFQGNARAQLALDRANALAGWSAFSVDGVNPLIDSALKMLEQAYEL